MAFSLPNAPYKSDWAQPMPDFGAALNKGITQGITPKFQSEQLLQSMLGNKIKGVEAKYKDQLMQAQIQQALAAAEHSRRAPTAPADIQTLEWLLKNKERFNQGNVTPTIQEEVPALIGEGQPSYVQALMGNRASQPPVSQEDYGQKLWQGAFNKAAHIKEATQYAPSNTAKELKEQADAEEGFIPNTGRKERFPTAQSQKEYLDALSAKTGRLKTGSHFILGDNGERIGESHPKTQKERDIDRGTVIFKEFYPTVNEGLNRYSGENSITNMENDARNYKTDPKARKRFDQLLLAKSLATLTTVNEAARFGAGKQNQVFNQFRKSLSNYDIPAKIDSLITQYQIPASANIKNGLRFQEMLDKADKKYHDTAEPNVNEYYPGKAPKSEDSGNPETWDAGEGIIQDPYTGEWATVPVAKGEWKEFLKDGGKRNG